MRPTLPALLLLLVAPLAAAQDHAHGAGDGVAWVLHDGPASGRAVVGDVTHFGFLLLDHDGMPLVHRNAEFLVEQDNATVFATTDTHEYDGHFSFDYAFTRPGPYRVIATSEQMETGVFEGVAIASTNATRVSILLETSPLANGILGTLSITDEEGNLVPHSDALAEFRDAAGALVARTHLHIHDAPIQFAQALPARPGMEAFELTVTASNAYPSGSRPDVRAAITTFPLHVPFTPPGAPTVPSIDGAPPILEPLGAKATQGEHALYALYDPQNQVGVGQTARLAGAIVRNATPLAHVDFTFMLRGPQGLVFQSDSLHEYDGVFEYLFVPDVPGLYEGTLVADTGDGELAVPFRLQVLPPIAPLGRSPGPARVSIDGLQDARAGAQTNLTFFVGGAAGAVQHSEVDVSVFHEGEAPVYRFKLHTHGSGETLATLVFPHAGHWTVRVDPLPTSPDPVVFEGPFAFAASVTGEAPASGTDINGVAVAQPVPGPGLALLLGGLAVGALARRR